jgi:hypothetical protein
LATPLLVTAGLVAWLLDIRLVGWLALGLTAAAVVSLLIGSIVSKLEGQRNPL